MELMKLRRRTQVAKRGHKLLKDKLDELMKHFLALVYQVRDLRREMEEKLAAAFQLFAVARSEASSQVIEEALLFPRAKFAVEVAREMRVNISIPRFEGKQEGTFDCYGLSTTPAILDQALHSFQELLPSLVRLAQWEKALELLAAEIERTRRRVNALEYVLIPQLEETVIFITMKLDEMERSYRTQLMKIKTMVSESA